MLPRVLEPELMDTDRDAREYDAMDHAAVNEQFVADLVDAIADWSLKRPVQSGTASWLEILDLGAGTAQIPIELCKRVSNVRVLAVDAAESMLAVARENVAAAGLVDRIELVLADAKRLPFGKKVTVTLDQGDCHLFPVVISNSIVHHIAEPRQVLAEAIRVTAPGGLLFHRDLCRPQDETELNSIVSTYVDDATPYQQKLFADSLRAALSPAEMQRLIAQFGFAAESVRMSSDRHWTWMTRNRL